VPPPVIRLQLKAVAESAEAARTDLSQAAEARGREVAAVRRELLDAKKRHSQLCDQLEALGGWVGGSVGVRRGVCLRPAVGG
jgi:hypothetical protein